jgi:hypothetical protein
MTNKTITINPELFKISNITRKNKSANNTKKTQKEIKIKSNKPKTEDTNETKKHKLLGYIRKKQKELEKEKENNIFSDNLNLPSSSSSLTIDNSYHNQPIETSTFENSVLFFKDIEQKEITPAIQLFNRNQTVKNYSNINPTIQQSSTTATPSIPHPNILFNEQYPETQIITPQTTALHLSSMPKYGILKNGNLPTYRQYMKQFSPPSNNSDPPTTTTTQPIPSSSVNHPSSNTLPLEINTHSNDKLNMADNLGKNTVNYEKNNKSRIYYPKRKKTVRRTFKIGRSKSNIGVLVSNKTIRNEIMTKKQLLKQTPMKEVKQFLLKKKLIKVGSLAPNDVLRKMYESASLICGDVENHNTDILLHNFFHEGQIK